MKLSDLRRRIADAIAPDHAGPPPLTGADWGTPAPLEPLENPPLPPDPNHAQPLTPEQRANLEKLRDRYAPDRQQRVIITSHAYVPGAQPGDGGCWHQDSPDLRGRGDRCGLYRQFHAE